MRLLLTILVLLASSVAAQTMTAASTRLSAALPSTVVLEGSSNVTDWRCRGTAVAATMLVASTPDHINAVIDRIEDGNIGVWMANPAAGRFPEPSFTLRVPVSAFRCGNRIMESDLRAALKAKDHPHVEFVLRGLRGGIQHDLDTGLYHATIAGDLSLAGITRPIELTLSASRRSRTMFRFRAELPLRMTTFGVKPPTALFGTVRAEDRLLVRFDLYLQVAPEGK